MILELASFEWRTAVRRPATLCYLAIYTLLGFVWTLAYSGVVPGMSITMGSEKLWVNSPHVLGQVIALVSLFGVFTLAGVMGRAGAGDFLWRSDALIFSKPISRFAYLGGRFLGAYGVLLLVFAGVPLGAWLAVHCGLMTPESRGPEALRAYLYPLMFSVWPNLFAGGAFFFCLTALTRRMTAVYVGAAVLLLGWMIASGLAAEGEGNGSLVYALLDPSGIFALDHETLYWSVAEKNQRLLTLSGAFLWNRLVWSGFGLACLALVFQRFSFQPVKMKQGRKDAVDETEWTVTTALRPCVPEFSSATFRAMWFRIAWLELRSVLANRYFAAILTCGVLFMFTGTFEMGQLMGTSSFPVTYLVLERVGDGFGLMILIMVAFYAGEIVHRERDAGLAQIYDALPLPNWIPFTAKATGLAALVLALLSVVLVCGVALQLLHGWTELNLKLYLVDLFVIDASRLLMMCVLAMFFHVVLDHKQLGHLAVIGYFLLSLVLLNIGAAHPLWLFAWAPPAPWSDMNGFGAALLPHLAYKIYWSAFCGVLLLLAAAMWRRGASVSLGARFGNLRALRGSRPVLVGVLALWLVVGGFLLYQDRVGQPFETRNTRLQRSARLEQRFGAYRYQPNFSVDRADYRIDLFASEGRLEMAGTYSLKNRHAQPLDRVMISVGRFMGLSDLAPEVPHQREVFEPDLGFYVFKLDEPVAPGEAIEFSFAYAFERPRLPALLPPYQLYRNGTFLERAFFPVTGFPEDRLIQSERSRKRFGLEPTPSRPDPDGPGVRLRSGLDGENSWASIRARVSTDLDQTAMVPAPLISSSEEGGRRVALFDSGEEQVLFFPSMVSARYEVVRDRWGSVDLEVFHHPGHDENVSRMMHGLKRSLAYCTEAFGPYPHQQVRILEFPRHNRFAQSLAGTIPFSEALGFIADVDEHDPDSVDYPFFVTAHELAHQWWPHQVLPADAKGADVLSETLTQYSALQIVKHELGSARMEPLLAFQRHMYLKARSELDHVEPVLAKVGGESFIYYYKGGLALFTLADRIGEERVNQALRNYLSEFGGRVDCFPTTSDLVRVLREVTPARFQYLIDDSFEHLTFYDLRLVTADVQNASDGSEQVLLSIEANKQRAIGLGDVSSVPMDDAVDIAFLNADGRIIQRESVWLEQGLCHVSLSLPEGAAEVVVDPFHLAMERVIDDNRLSITRD